MPLSGSRISHYQILRQLGKGGMGEVWLAHDSVLDRQVAIKFLPENIQADEAARGRFIREAKAAAALDHPFICKIYETGESGGQTFIVMEYVEGCSLRDRMGETALSTTEALQVAQEIADALEVAHAKGIIHRDLKPANIMCTPQGHAKVMDFGIAKRIVPGTPAISSPSQLAGPIPDFDIGRQDPAALKMIQATLTQAGATVEGMIMGTIDYMSPEQARGVPVDGRSDIFSLGVILYEMLSGKHPFSKTTPIETLTSVIKDPPPAFSVKPKNVNPVAHHIIKKCLAKNPDERYADIKEFSAEIKKAKDEIVGRLPFFLRGWWAAATGVVVFTLVGLVAWRYVLHPKPAVEAAPDPVSVLVVDFTNRTNDPVFAGAVEQSLIIGLEEVSYVNIYKREDARKKAGQLDPNAKGKLDAALGQLVCRSEGVQTLIDGSIEPKGSGGYALKIWATDPVSSKQVAAVEKSVGKKIDVMNAAANLSLSLCKKLGGGPVPSRQSLNLETFTTSSLEAMNAYAKAQELAKQGLNVESIQEYQKAIQADPKFGRAYSGLAVVYYNNQEREKAEEYHQMALAHIDSMNDREKYRTRGIWYLMTQNAPKAIEEFSSLVKLYPADFAGHANLALAYFFAREMAKAEEEGLAYLKIYPNNINGQYNMSWYAIGAGNFGRALEQAQKALDLNPKFEKAFICAALAELAQGQIETATEWYRKLEPISFWGSSLSSIGQADIALYEGRTNDAVKILERGIEADMKNDRKDLAAEKWIMLGQARLLSGQNGAALNSADRALALSRDVSIAFPAAEIYIQAGKTEKALSLAGELRGLLEPDPRAYASLIEGLAAQKAGRTAEAVKEFTDAQKIVDTWRGRLALAESYLAAKAFAEAHSELESCLRRRGEAASLFFNDIPSYRYFPRTYYDLARAQEGLKSPEAKATYETFLKIKEKCDGDPLVKEARRLASQL